MLSKKTSIISIRLPDEIKQKLERESEINGTTLNTLATQVLSRHTDWDRFAKDLGFIFSTRKFLKGILTDVSDKTVEKIASTTCKDAVKDVVIFSFSEVTLENFVKTFRLWLAASDIPFRFIPNSENDGGRFLVQHELGPKYSLYLQTMSGTILNEIGYRVKNIESTDDSLNFEVELAK